MRHTSTYQLHRHVVCPGLARFLKAVAQTEAGKPSKDQWCVALSPFAAMHSCTGSLRCAIEVAGACSHAND